MICKIKKSKLLSAFLAIAMIVTLMPVTAFAAEPPTLVSAAVTSDGGVGLTFSKEMSATDLANKIKAGFTITGLEETPKTITNVSLHSVSGGTNNFVQLYLNPTIKGGEAAGLSYTPGDVQAADGGLLAEIASMDIENNAPHPDLDTTAPPAATVGSSYTHTFTANGGTSPYTFSVDSGSLPIGLTMSSTGVISGTPTVEASFTFFIMIKDANQALDIEGFSITVSPPTDKVCEIDGAQYATLDAALAAVPADGTATIQLLRNIDHNEGVALGGKKITFALNGYTLNVNNPAEGGVGLDVQQGGAVSLTGSGALNVTGKAYGVRVTSNVLASSATVTNATASGSEGRAAYAAGPATITVLGDATVTGINAYGAHAISKAVIDIKGNVIATNQGVYASDATIKVAGNVMATGLNILDEPVGIGVGVYAGTVEIGGNITANRVGVMMRNNGKATIDGTVTAPAYIQFADDAPTEIDGYLDSTTKTGYRTYQHAMAGNVWIKGETLPATYALTVENGTGDGSYAAGISVSITAYAAPVGKVFDRWTTSGGGTFADVISASTTFTMPAQAVTVTATYKDSESGGNVSATILPAMVTFDKNPVKQADVSTTITWNDAASVTDVKKTGVSVGAAVYAVSGNTLTIHKEYLALQPVGSLVLTVEFDKGIETFTIGISDTTPPAGGNPPTWPVGSTLTASGTTKTRTTLNWTAAADDLDVTGYRIYQDHSLLQTVTGAVYNCEVTELSTSTTYTFQVQAGDADNNWTDGPTVTVHTDSSGGGGGSSTSIPAPEPKLAAQVLDSNGNISKTITIQLDNSTGTTKVKVDAASLTSAFDRSITDGKGVKTVEVDIPKIDGVKAYELVLPASFLTSGYATRTVEIKTGLAAVTVPGDMLGVANAAGAQNVSLTIAAGDKTKLDAAVQAQIGDRPVIELNLKIDGKQISWSNENAQVTVSIPYIPTAAELANPESIVIWYIDGAGNAVSVPNGHYDPTTGTVTFSTTHFSYYTVGFNKISFNDVVPDAWYNKAVSFIAARGITTGTGGGNYSPDAKLTRAQFIVMLMKAYDIAQDANPKDNFFDAGSTYYTDYLAAAKRLGISEGVGNNMFAPEKEITRQEMFTLLYNALKVIGQLPQGDSGKTLDHFIDAGQISSWAKGAMRLLVKTGTISGNTGKLSPTSTTTRAEMAQVLYNLLSK